MSGKTIEQCKAKWKLMLEGQPWINDREEYKHDMYIGVACSNLMFDQAFWRANESSIRAGEPVVKDPDAVDVLGLGIDFSNNKMKGLGAGIAILLVVAALAFGFKKLKK
jgi:hypothetical protein